MESSSGCASNTRDRQCSRCLMIDGLRKKLMKFAPMVCVLFPGVYLN